MTDVDVIVLSELLPDPATELEDDDYVVLYRSSGALPPDKNKIMSGAVLKSQVSTPLNRLAIVINTNSVTNLNVIDPGVIVPLSGILTFSHADFTKTINGLQCNFNGKVRVTAIINNFGVGIGTDKIVQGKYRVVVGGTILQNPAMTWVNLNNTETGGKQSHLCGSMLVSIVDVLDGQNIEINSVRVAGIEPIFLNNIENTSQLMLERI